MLLHKERGVNFAIIWKQISTSFFSFYRIFFSLYTFSVGSDPLFTGLFNIRLICKHNFSNNLKFILITFFCQFVELNFFKDIFIT